MRMAKAHPEEFDKTMDFVNVMDSLLDDRWFFSQEESWRDWDDDDEDKKLLLKIEQELKDYEGEDDYRIILYEFIKRKWREANRSGSFGRIIMDAETLIQNCCDPDLDYLDFKPEMKKAFEEYNENHKDDEDVQKVEE